MEEVGAQGIRPEVIAMMMSRILRVVPVFLVALAAAAPAQDAVDEFKKYIRSKEVAVRRDQVERLARVNTVEAASLLMAKGLTDPDYSVREKAQWSLSRLTDEARLAVYSGLSSPKPSIREGVCMAISQMKHSEAEPPFDTIGGLVTADRSELVRAAAAESLGMMSASKAVPAIISGLNDGKERVVIACADALGLIADPRGGAPLIPLLDHASWRAQVAALSAMAKIRSRKTIGPVIEYLAVAQGRAREDAHRALTKITNRQYGMNPDTWREWWGRMEKTDWKVPPAPKKVEVKAVPGGKDGYGRNKPTRYHRITTYSKRIIFVIDISNSMKTPILVKEGKETKGRRLSVGVEKMLLAREELKRTLEAMDSSTYFNVIAFETDIRKFKKSPVKASAGNVQAATRWLEKQKPRGAARTTVGKASSNVNKQGWIRGKTNSYGALAEVYGLKVDHERGGVRSTTASPSPSGKKRPRWDTCFFLSDGRPTVGVVTDIELILQDVKRWNKTCKMVIHCIGMENEQGLADLLRGLARVTGGQTVFLGK